MSKLEEKQKALHKKGMNLFEKKAIRKALGALGPMCLVMECPMDAAIINISIPPGEKRIEIVLSNSINDNTLDASHKAEELENAHPIFVDIFEKFADLMREMAEYWNTPENNVVSQFFSNEKMEIKAFIKPKKGFPDYEKIEMS